MTALETINAFWVGPRLGRLHAACLKSFKDHGHRVILHTFQSPPEDLPPGIETADASLLLSKDQIITHRKKGSVALTADLFRYELMAAEAGVYVDCDCFCVRPIKIQDYILGWETDAQLCNAVLKMPPTSPLLAAMRKIGDPRGFIPPWEKKKRKRLYKLRSMIKAPVPLSEMKWGTTGPIALTYYAKKTGLSRYAQPSDVFYPLHYHHINLLQDAGIKLDDIISSRTQVIHLWNEYLRHKHIAPEANSPLANILKTIPDHVEVDISR